MRRETSLRLMALTFCALMGLNFATLALAAPTEQGIRAIITSPRMNAVVRGQVQITGSALHTDFQFYKVEFNSAATPGQWIIVSDMRHNQVGQGVLDIWDTTRIPDGTYNLRLRVVDNTGNYAEHIVRQVVVANAQPTKTPTPTSTPTLTPTSSPPPILTPTIIVGWLTPGIAPSPTPTSIPTALTTPAAVTATPTRIPSSSLIPTRSRFSIDMAAVGRAFLVGAGLSSSLFVLLGIFALLRRFIG